MSNEQSPPQKPQKPQRVISPLRVALITAAGVALALWLMIPAAGPSASAQPGQFDLHNLQVPRDELRSGGPPKDGIPAILHPKFDTARRASYMRPDDVVVGLAAQGEAKAYPLKILNHHEIVNDEIGGRPVAVTYCPLCGTAMVFDRRVNGRTLTFGVSGLLFRSDLVMYDHQNDALWSQLLRQALSGPLAGAPLEWLPSSEMTWEAWVERHPDTRVLSVRTGYRRDYQADAYGRYHSSPGTMFPIPTNREELPTKAWVIGVIVNGTAKAYPLSFLKEQGGSVTDVINGAQVRVSFDPQTTEHRAAMGAGTVIPSVRVYWFAWQAFYPKTLLAR